VQVEAHANVSAKVMGASDLKCDGLVSARCTVHFEQYERKDASHTIRMGSEGLRLFHCPVLGVLPGPDGQCPKGGGDKQIVVDQLLQPGAIDHCQWRGGGCMF